MAYHVGRSVGGPDRPERFSLGFTGNPQGLAGRSLKSTFHDGTHETVLQTNLFDNLGRLVSSTDADDVTSLTACNAKGEPTSNGTSEPENFQWNQAPAP